MTNLKEERNEINAKWKSEKEVVDNIQNVKSEIESLKIEAEKAEREGDYGKVAEIRYGKIKVAQEQLEGFQKTLSENQAGNSLIKEEVTYEDIAEVVAKWTGIPVTKMIQSERDKLLKLEQHLHKRVIGQEECHILKYVDHFLLLNGLNISNWQANLWVGFFSFFSPKKEK